MVMCWVQRSLEASVSDCVNTKVSSLPGLNLDRIMALCSCQPSSTSDNRIACNKPSLGCHPLSGVVLKSPEMGGHSSPPALELFQHAHSLFPKLLHDFGLVGDAASRVLQVVIQQRHSFCRRRNLQEVLCLSKVLVHGQPIRQNGWHGCLVTQGSCLLSLCHPLAESDLTGDLHRTVPL